MVDQCTDSGYTPLPLDAPRGVYGPESVSGVRNQHIPNRVFRKKTIRRPRKSETVKRRRQKIHRDRLIALGVPEEKVLKMDPTEVRTLLKRPNKVAK